MPTQGTIPFNASEKAALLQKRQHCLFQEIKGMVPWVASRVFLTSFSTSLPDTVQYRLLGKHMVEASMHVFRLFLYRLTYELCLQQRWP